MKIKDNIKKLRISKAMKQKELADALGVTRTTVSNWETGAVIPNGKALSALADYFGVTTDYICGMEQSQEEPIDKIALIDRIMEADDKTIERLCRYFDLLTERDG